MAVIIPNPLQLQKIKNQVKQQGSEKLHILTDFDKTLTYGTVDGIYTPGMIALLRDGHHLTPEYAPQAQALFDKYHPQEIALSIPLKEKKQAMKKWWSGHLKLLIDSGLSKADLEDVIKSKFLKLRRGVPQFLKSLNNYNIPLVILSANAIGEAIEMLLNNIGYNYPNIDYVINRFKWDQNGNALSAQKTLITSLDKDETILKDFPQIYKNIKTRTNVILIGDNIGDIGMVEGFEYENLIKIGFLNLDFDKYLDEYKQNFDIIVEGEADFAYCNHLLKEVTQ